MSLALRATAELNPVVQDFLDRGLHLFPEPVDPIAAINLLADLRAERRYDESLFLSQAEFDADPQYTGVNPQPGRNLLERFEHRLGFIEQSPQVVEGLVALLGPGYRVLNRKVVCGVPARSIPAWLKARILGNPVNNLGAYVKPQYRDVTYFYGIDFHQDLIDYKDRDANFITLYVYLHPVTRLDAPLYVLEASHSLGATVFPHLLTRQDADHWLYEDGRGGAARVRQRILVGQPGFAAMWHACTLHGTQPDAADHERISLRYVFEPAHGPGDGMARVNAALKGPLRLGATRADLAEDGSARLRGNIVNQG